MSLNPYSAMLRLAAIFLCAWISLVPIRVSASEAASPFPDLEGPLSAEETELLADARDGSLDSFSLFSAALVAGGVHDRDRIAAYERRLESLLVELRPSVDARTSQLAKAKEVFEFMHRTVLAGGYRLECSRLSTLLDDGRYNCVSASILYKVLATEFNLQVVGLEVPGHAMCRLVLGNETLEVESTCPRWFSLVDQPEKREAVIRKAMGCSLGGVRIECREVTDVQWLATIYYNRGIDLLAEKDFAGAVGANAKALRLDRTNEIARGNLLASLNNWAIHLSTQELHATAVEKLLRGLEIDPEFETLHANYAHVHGRWLDALCRSGRFEEAARVAREALASYPEEPSLEEKRLLVFECWARREMSEGRSAEAFSVFDRAIRECGRQRRDRIATLESAAVIDTATDLLRHGRKAAAMALYEAALERNPHSRSLAANHRTLVPKRERLSESQRMPEHERALEKGTTPVLVPVSTERETVF